MKIAIASDHGGFALKKEIVEHLKKNKIAFEDLGPNSEASVDYPDYAALVAKKVAAGQADRGILVCGTGVGMAITANKFRGIRAAMLDDLFTAKLTREHNDLNVLCLGGRITAPPAALEIVKTFLETPFAGERHRKRLDKIQKIEEGGS